MAQTHEPAQSQDVVADRAVSTPREYFERLYASDPDPWGFAERWYERRKYELTLACLPSERYRRGFEPGCSVGVLSAMLALRCDDLVCSDHMPVALAEAHKRLEGLGHVEVVTIEVPQQWPPGVFDLIVLSEIAYYFDEATLAGLMSRVDGTLAPGGTVIAVHWRGDTDYPLTADRTHELIGSADWLCNVVHHVEPEVVVDVWLRQH